MSGERNFSTKDVRNTTRYFRMFLWKHNIAFNMHTSKASSYFTLHLAGEEVTVRLSDHPPGHRHRYAMPDINIQRPVDFVRLKKYIKQIEQHLLNTVDHGGRDEETESSQESRSESIIEWCMPPESCAA